MPKVLILAGLPGSGKSTFANTFSTQEDWVITNWDRLRHYDADGNPVVYKFNNDSEKAIRQASLAEVKAALASGKNVIVDNTNLTDTALNLWKNFATENGATWEVHSIDTPLDECLRRNAERDDWRKVPRAVIERMALVSGRVPWPDGQWVAVVDKDGTLADLEHRRHMISGKCILCPTCSVNGPDSMYCSFCNGTGKAKKDWRGFELLCHLDPVRTPVAEWVRQLHSVGYYICIVSGRKLDIAGDLTIQWLEKNEIPFDRIFMRNRGDSRDDTVVKKEILDCIGKNRIAFAIDDRPKVIRMWRENGVKTYDVGNGVEF